MAEDFTQVNVNLTNEDVKKLDDMTAQDALYYRSAFVRKLIREEYKRRHPGIIAPNQVITVQ